MYLVQILLPLRDGQRQPFARSAFEKVQAELTDRFGGATAFLNAPAFGAWRDEGQTVHDPVVLFEVMTGGLDRRWWAGYRKELEARFRQDSVVIRAVMTEPL